MTQYPYLGDSPLVQARRAALAYRQRLEPVDPDGCAELDRLFTRWGLSWIVPRPLPDLDAYVSARDAADIAAVGMATLRQLRRRNRLVGKRVGVNRWEYKVADVLALGTAPRTRNGGPV